LYTCETWPTTKGDKDKLAIFERRIFGPKINNITQLYEKRSNIRPKQRWIDQVEKNLAEIGMRDGETIAQDRDRRKQVCVVVMALNGL